MRIEDLATIDDTRLNRAAKEILSQMLEGDDTVLKVGSATHTVMGLLVAKFVDHDRVLDDTIFERAMRLGCIAFLVGATYAVGGTSRDH